MTRNANSIADEIGNALHVPRPEMDLLLNNIKSLHSQHVPRVVKQLLNGYYASVREPFSLNGFKNAKMVEQGLYQVRSLLTAVITTLHSSHSPFKNSVLSLINSGLDVPLIAT